MTSDLIKYKKLAKGFVNEDFNSINAKELKWYYNKLILENLGKLGTGLSEDKEYRGYVDAYSNMLMKFFERKPKYTKKLKYMLYMYSGLITIGSPLEWIKSFYLNKSEHNIKDTSRYFYNEFMTESYVSRRLKQVSKDIKLKPNCISNVGTCLMSLDNDSHKSEQYNIIKMDDHNFIIYDSALPDEIFNKIINIFHIKTYNKFKLKDSLDNFPLNISSLDFNYHGLKLIISVDLF